MQSFLILKTKAQNILSFSKSILSFGILLLASISCFAQGFPNNPNDQNFNIEQDTLSGDTTINREGMFKTLFSGKPGRAAFYSLVIPGGGQIYNRKYWKWPIAAAIDGAGVYWLVFTRSNYKTYQKQLEDGLASPTQPTNINDIRALRNQYRKLSEYAWVYLIAGHMIPVFDAYVDRHLMDFDVSPDLSTIPMTSSGRELSYTGLKFTLYLDK